MKTLSNYNKVLLGKVDGEKIYLSPPSWDCDWYWGFGYLGNKDCHYHVDGMDKDVGLHTAFKNHFGDTFIVTNDNDVWTLAELFASFYTLKEYAEMCHTGGAHLTSNPCKGLLKNKSEEDRINNVVLPQVFEEIYKILNKY